MLTEASGISIYCCEDELLALPGQKSSSRWYHVALGLLED